MASQKLTNCCLLKFTLQKPDNKNSEYFSIWWRDSDPVYVVGFDKTDNVAVKHRFFMMKQKD
jgi:hypothetical protein